jgi:hydrogenase nickel incorporation protein HypB
MHVEVVESILKLNDDVARLNRQRLHDSGVFTIDIIGGPGCEKTTLVQKTVDALKDEFRMAVIVGDLSTARDAQRIAEVCPQVVQINTGKGCHLEAHQIRQAMERVDFAKVDLLIIENVGNLVCPVGFDLGQDAKVGMFCTTEGADKPAKYPHLVEVADVLLLNKVDLLPYLNFDMEGFRADIKRLKPNANVLEIAAHTNQMGPWIDWLRERTRAAKAQLAVGA